MKKGVRDYSTNITTCIVKIISLWREMVQESGVEATFISTDIGKYGSSGIRMSKQVPEDASKLFHAIKNSTLQNYDKTFAAVTGENSNEKGYISVLQKALASRAKCLLLVGGGSYQAHTLHLYKQLHPKEQCVKIIAERSEANNRDLWAQQSQLASIYIYIYISIWEMSVTLGGPRGSNTCSKWRLW